jgi:hypothetical protein
MSPERITSAFLTQLPSDTLPLLLQELSELLSLVCSRVCTNDQSEAISALIEILAATLRDSLHEKELRLLIEFLK